MNLCSTRDHKSFPKIISQMVKMNSEDLRVSVNIYVREVLKKLIKSQSFEFFVMSNFNSGNLKE